MIVPVSHMISSIFTITLQVNQLTSMLGQFYFSMKIAKQNKFPRQKLAQSKEQADNVSQIKAIPCATKGI